MNSKRRKNNLFVLGILVGAVLSAPIHAHQGSSTAEPRLVCAKKNLGASCEWKDDHEALYKGSCRKVSSSLLCVRNKPIVYPKVTHHEQTASKNDKLVSENK